MALPDGLDVVRADFGTARVDRAGGQTVVWLRGEHDIATAAALSDVLADAMAFEADVIVDLRHVQFMDAATVRVVVQAQQLLRARARSLTVRSPSSAARRILQLCDLDGAVGQPAMRTVTDATGHGGS